MLIAAFSAGRAGPAADFKRFAVVYAEGEKKGFTVFVFGTMATGKTGSDLYLWSRKCE